jgi:AraC-like DNA-binding protein
MPARGFEKEARRVKGLTADKCRQALEPPFLTLPGLMMFGHNTSARAEAPLGLHRHEGCMEFVLIVKGEECFYTEGKMYRLHGQEIFVSFADEPHCSAEPYQGPSEFYWFQLKLSCSEGFLGLSGPVAGALAGRLLALQDHVMPAHKEAAGLARRCLDVFLRQESEPAPTAAFLNLLTCILSAPGGQRRDENFQNALRYIETHLEDAIAMEDLCRVSGFSDSTIKHRFLDYAGATPREYINRQKILYARTLLRSGLSVTDTAMRLGFNSPAYFSAVFRRYLRVSPSGFARQAPPAQTPGGI